MKARRGLRLDDRGAELIELAIAMPILFLLVAAIVDMGFLFQRYEVVTNAAREGARVAVLPGYSVADVQARVTSYLTASGLTASIPAPSVVYGTQTLPSGTIENIATVTVDYPNPFSILGPAARMVVGGGGGSWSQITLRAQSVMRVEAAGS